ncbi:YhcN/YlaJ family sporulation lipoprotein [Paenibacillus mendelii]|uniref:YhcN/YlaJ family sporulation lipoprotein n=1 Tax=Paenibacillus mendelii TaxID=206163 RepID=A0ABV6JEJ3_9BACL|nr:YhcN/YlaJ family sporulation lipoprotein [Paenibacillus mendelii]MCQ6557197.1 YhcN/YlaJ family sporulation lipoprotein [Paenibacillus mendelii]
MKKRMSTFKVSIMLTTSLMLFATGCTNTQTDNNQVRQQTRDNYRGPEIFRDRNNDADNRINRPLGDIDNQRLTDERNDRLDTNNFGTYNDNDGLKNAEDQVEIANLAAENITKLKGVERANVLVTRRNAYVAAALDEDQKKMTREIEDQIAKQVRKTDSDIQNVYVSTNPQFTDRINKYVEDVQQGRPVIGFVEQFNEMVARIFPNAR